MVLPDVTLNQSWLIGLTGTIKPPFSMTVGSQVLSFMAGGTLGVFDGMTDTLFPLHKGATQSMPRGTERGLFLSTSFKGKVGWNNEVNNKVALNMSSSI